MAGSTEILQEYLIKIGYQSDSSSLKKFEDGLSSTSKKILGVGTAVGAAVIAVEAAAAEFAYSMRKIYFQSELSNTSVKNLKSMEYAGKQFGISAETMASTIQTANEKIFASHGALVEYASALTGMNEAGKETGAMLQDLIQAVPNDTIGAQIMAQYGMDQETFMLWKAHAAEIKAKTEEQRAMFARFGLDLDAQKTIILQYTSSLDKLESSLSTLGSVVLGKTVGPFLTLSRWLDHILEGLTHLAAFGLKYESGSRVDEFLNGKPKTSNSAVGKIAKPTTIFIPGRLPGELTHLPERKSQTSKFSMENLEKQYSLPPGLLHGTWGAESSFGKQMMSPAGAKGHMGFMGPTAKQFGVTDPNNLENSATGTAKMYSYLLKKYNGNLKLAQYAYNWGEGNVDSWIRTGKGIKGQPMPNETKEYPGRVASFDTKLGAYASGNVQMSQNTTINVTGTGAEATAKAVERKQNEVNRTLARNLKGPVA